MSRPTILLIEDDQAFAALVREVVTDAVAEDIRVEHATTLAAGVARAGECPPAAVVLDMRLPDADGLETVVRARRALRDLPIVVVTSFAGEFCGDDVILAGADRYLSKASLDDGTFASEIRGLAGTDRSPSGLEPEPSERPVVRVLLVEDSRPDADLVMETLAEVRERRFVVQWFERIAEAVAYGTATTRPDVVLLDLNLPDADGLEAFVRARAAFPDLPIVIMTGLTEEATERAVLHGGACDYLVKGECNPQVLVRALLHAVDQHRVNSDRDRAYDLLRESEARYRRIVETAQEGIWVIDSESRTTFVNVATARMLGYSIDEMIGRPIFEFMREEERAAAEASIDRRRAGIDEQVEFRLRRRDDSDLWALLNTNSFFDADGRYAGALAMITDIGPLKRAREHAEQAHQSLSAIVDGLPIAVFKGRADTGAPEYVSRNIETISGFAAQEFLDRPTFWQERLHPDDVPGVVSDFAAMPAQTEFCREVRWQHRDGTYRWLQVLVRLIPDLSGGPGSLVGTWVDITDRKAAELAAQERDRLEDRLRQAERLESLGRLTGGIAHDFNNLLAAILNYAEFVSKEVPAGSRAAEDVAEIRRAAQRAADLTRQLLLFGRQELGRDEVFDLNEVVGEIERLLRRTIGEHVQLSTSLSDGLWSLKGDPGRLEQVLVNLAVNARDAMPEGGTLAIETANVELHEEDARAYGDARPGRYVRLTVTDSGVGMPPEVADRALEPFFTTKPRGRGTGLGLATVYGIVRSAGGHITIYSEPGRGTCVKALLPATEETACSPVVRGAPGLVDGAGETILVVEDDAQVRAVASRVLSDHGYRVVECATGDEAIEAFEAQPDRLDMVLTDLVMPGMSGKDIAERALALRPGLPILYMSGYTHDVVKRREELSGPVIEKPFSRTALLRGVEEVLRQRGRRS